MYSNNKSKQTLSSPESAATPRARSDGYTTVRIRRWNPLEKRYGRWRTIVNHKHNVLTVEGRDWMHAQVYTNTAAGTRGSNFIALTETNITPAASDTTLSGEITTNGLQRIEAGSINHTNDSNSTALQHTFTAGASFSTVRGSALFNASSAGILSHINTFTSTALATNDQLQVTWTLQLG